MAVLDFIETESESRCSTQLMRLQGQECKMKENLYRNLQNSAATSARWNVCCTF